MKKSVVLAHRFKEVILNGTWIANTNYKHQLTGLDWKVATATIHSLNSIAVLAQHIHYYIKGIKNVFEGGSLDIKDQYSFNFGPIKSETDWQNFLDTFWEDAEAFAWLVEALPEEQLQKTFVHEQYGSYERNIDAMIEHSYYHLGQIVLLKKMLTNTGQSSS